MPAMSWTMPAPWRPRLIEGGVDIVSGGTDSHVVLVDLRPKDLTGKATEASRWSGPA